MTNENINDYLRLAIMEEVNKRMGKNFECVNDLIDYAKNLEQENKQLKADIIEIEKVSDYRFEENERLKAINEKLKCCGNCFHNNKPSDKEFCLNCERQLNDGQPIIKDEWEIFE